jgi:hypothetical protein
MTPTLIAVTAMVTAMIGTALPTPARAAPLLAVGVNDNLTLRHDRTATVAAPGVLGNDLNLLGGTTARLTQGVAHGSLDLRPDGGYTYIPNAGYVGSDSFRYRPSALLGLGTEATVSITVTNVAPVARNDSYSTPARTTLVVPAPGVLANDTDADGDALIAEIDGGGVSGSLDLDSNGAFRFSPGGGFTGSQSFQYRVWDGVSWSTATVTLTVATPTPSPTPTPTPTPLLPVPPPPLPSLSVPSLAPLPTLGPLPSLPSLGSLQPRPTATPSAPAGDPRPERTPQPSPGASAGNRSEPSAEQSAAPEGEAAQPGGQSGGPGDDAAPVESGAGGEAGGGRQVGEPTVDLSFDSGLEVKEVNLVAGFGVYAVPAAVLAGPGVLLLVWVALQTVGAAAWIPAVRRLRGRDEWAGRPR